jgi:hypothetical protein
MLYKYIMAKSRKEKRNRRTKRRGNKRMTRKRGAGLLDLLKSTPKIVPDSPGPLGEIEIKEMKPYNTNNNEESIMSGNIVYLFEYEGNIFIIPRIFGERTTMYNDNICLYEIFEKLTEKDIKNEVQKLSEKFKYRIGLFINTTKSTCSFVNIKLSTIIAANTTSDNVEDSVITLTLGKLIVEGYDLTNDISIKYKGNDYKSLLIKLLYECRDENRVQAFKNDDDGELYRQIVIKETKKPTAALDGGPTAEPSAGPSEKTTAIINNDITVEDL